MPITHIDQGVQSHRVKFHIVGDATLQNSIANPFGGTVLIRRAELYSVSPATAANNISIGIGAAAAGNNDILGATAANGLAAGTFRNCFAAENTAATLIAAPILWTAANFLTFTGAATLAGYEGYLLLEVIPLPDRI